METDLHIVLVEPEIPHNAGAVGRLCVGLGCTLHLVRPMGFALTDHHLRRAGLDYWPHLRLSLHDSWPAFLARLQPCRLHLASTAGSVSLYERVFRSGDVLVFGSESRGLDPAIRAAHGADLFRIPMPGLHGRSINLANAAAIAAYEAYRQISRTAYPCEPPR